MINSLPPGMSPASDWLAFSLIMECADLIGSFAISLREAAWRESTVTTEVSLRQIRATVNTAVETLKEIKARASEGVGK